jgi:hypothetical protein
MELNEITNVAQHIMPTAHPQKRPGASYVFCATAMPPDIMRGSPGIGKARALRYGN